MIRPSTSSSGCANAKNDRVPVAEVATLHQAGPRSNSARKGLSKDTTTGTPVRVQSQNAAGGGTAPTSAPSCLYISVSTPSPGVCRLLSRRHAHRSSVGRCRLPPPLLLAATVAPDNNLRDEQPQADPKQQIMSCCPAMGAMPLVMGRGVSAFNIRASPAFAAASPAK